MGMLVPCIGSVVRVAVPPAITPETGLPIAPAPSPGSSPTATIVPLPLISNTCVAIETGTPAVEFNQPPQENVHLYVPTSFCVPGVYNLPSIASVGLLDAILTI